MEYYELRNIGNIIAKRKLTLKDRLSRLTFTQACKLLGNNGSKLIIQGGKFEITSIEDDVYLDDSLFRLNVDGVTITIKLQDDAK